MRVTMQEIGQQLGVSKVTVSKALNDKPGVSTEMREKIRQKAVDLGYIAAAEQKGLDVGVLIPNRFFSPESFYSMLYKMLVEELNKAGHFALLELLGAEMEEQGQLPNLLRSHRVDALVLLGEPTKEYLRLLSAQDTPLVFLDFYDENASTDAVVGDSAYGSYRLTSHLIKNGHTKIGFVGEPMATSSIMDRYLGFYRALISHGLSLRRDWIIPDRDPQGKEVEMVLPEELPTAFVCCCDLSACTLMEKLEERGLRIPDDISVVGFDDFCAGRRTPVPLSTFRVNYDAMIQKTVQLVQDHFREKQGIGGRFVIGGTPIYRASEKKITE